MARFLEMLAIYWILRRELNSSTPCLHLCCSVTLIHPIKLLSLTWLGCVTCTVSKKNMSIFFKVGPEDLNGDHLPACWKATLWKTPWELLVDPQAPRCGSHFLKNVYGYNLMPGSQTKSPLWFWKGWFRIFSRSASLFAPRGFRSCCGGLNTQKRTVMNDCCCMFVLILCHLYLEKICQLLGKSTGSVWECFHPPPPDWFSWIR